MSAAASAFWLWPSAEVAGLSSSSSSIPMSAPTARTLVTDEGPLDYVEQRYTPAWRLEADAPPEELATPEDAVLAYALAVRAGDWEGAQVLLDPESRRARTEAGAARGISGEDRAELWRRHFGQRALVASRRASTRLDGAEVVFVVLAREGADERERRTSPALAVTTGRDGRWLVTDAYRTHPLPRELVEASLP